MDTTQFNALSPEEYKQNTQKHWSSDPCGSLDSRLEIGTMPYFKEIAAARYEAHDYILDAIRSFDIAGKQTLEIGFGMGTDHVNLAQQGAIMNGLDLTPRNREIAEKHLAIHGLTSNLVTGDAEAMPFADNSMDFVYSFGVIHHSPNTEKIVSEIHRVLKPGGKCWIAVYHKNSIFFWWTVYLTDWIARRGFRRETLKERISRIEYPNNTPDLVIRLYKRKEFAALFSAFSKVATSVEHLVGRDVFLFGDKIPASVYRKLSKRFGWYVIVSATK